jgi:hypothetical protein
MNELRVCRVEEALTHRAETRLGTRPRFDRDLEGRRERHKVIPVKVLPAVNDDDLRQPAGAANTVSYDHHVRTVARRVERQVNTNDPPGIGVHHERRPGAA